jgi:hypothetical protein
MTPKNRTWRNVQGKLMCGGKAVTNHTLNEKGQWTGECLDCGKRVVYSRLTGKPRPHQTTNEVAPPVCDAFR